jgi:hypothetical protein
LSFSDQNLVDLAPLDIEYVYDRQHEIHYNNKKEFEDTKGVIRVRKSKKDRQRNGQKKKDKRTNNDLQIITHKTKDLVTRPPIKTSELRCSEG